MEELGSKKVDWKKIAIVGALVFLTAVTIGGLTWYVVTAGAQEEKEVYENDVARLEAEIEGLQEKEQTNEVPDVGTGNAEIEKREELLRVCQNTHMNDSVEIRQYEDNYAECKYRSVSNVSGAVGSVFFKYNNGSWAIILDTQAVNEEAETMLLKEGFPKEFFNKPWLS